MTWGPQDAFLCQVDPNAGALVYSTYLGGELADQGRAIAVAPTAWSTLRFPRNSTEFPMAGYAYNYSLTSPIGMVLGVMDMTQVGADSLVYSTYFGGSDIQEVRGIAFDSAGNLLVTGYTLAKDFPVTPDAVQPKAGGNGDAFVSVVNPMAYPNFLVYSTYLGGSQGEVAYGIAGDSAGNIYVTGYTLSPDFPTTRDAFEPYWGDGIDLFLTKLKPGIPGPAGLQSSTYIGQSGVYSPTGLDAGTRWNHLSGWLGYLRPAEYRRCAPRLRRRLERRLHHGAGQIGQSGADALVQRGRPGRMRAHCQLWRHRTRLKLFPIPPMHV